MKSLDLDISKSLPILNQHHSELDNFRQHCKNPHEGRRGIAWKKQDGRAGRFMKIRGTDDCGREAMKPTGFTTDVGTPITQMSIPECKMQHLIRLWALFN